MKAPKIERKETKDGNVLIVVRPGDKAVSIYRRRTPQWTEREPRYAFMVANPSEGKRRFDCYPTEDKAIEEAEKLAKRLDKLQVNVAKITEREAAEYFNSQGLLQPFNVTLLDGAHALAKCLKVVGDLSAIEAAVKFYAENRKTVTPKLIADVVTELLKVKRERRKKERYLEDLKSRLDRFSRDNPNRMLGDVTPGQVQEWLDGLSLSRQSYRNYWQVLHLLFKFGVIRGYAAHNPVAQVEREDPEETEIQIFTPEEISRLLAAATPDFLPCVAIGAFAGLRSAEVERLEWSDIDLVSRHITLSAAKAKTASRRIVPIHDNLAAWLAPYSEKQGKVWKGSSDMFYRAQEATAAATEVKADPEKGIKAVKPVKWRGNGLRHSYVSYRFAQIGDAGRVAGECGNSPRMIFKHYRELVKPAAAAQWFSIRPEAPANVLTLQPQTAN